MALLTVSAAHAQNDPLDNNEIITRARMVGMGYTSILDTYLSPVTHTGAELRYISHITRQMPGSRYTRQLIHQGNFADVEDRSGKSSEMAGLYDLSYAIHYNWPLCGGKLHIQAGGMIETGIGVIYNTRNQNNPAQLRLFTHLAPSAVATYRFKLFGLKCSTRYEVSVPLVGLMFSPNYGQSYYEIFSLGNYDHNCVVTTPFSAPSMRQMLTLDIALRSTTLRVGYLGDIQQSKVNLLKQHVNTHAMVIGFVKKFSIMKIEDD